MSELSIEWQKKLSIPFLDLEAECRKTEEELDMIESLNSKETSGSKSDTNHSQNHTQNFVDSDN